jgi:uncharacterized protein (TIGR02466 family)
MTPETFIQPIFPTPVYISKIKRKLNQNELNYIDEEKKISLCNVENRYSNNSDVLKHSTMQNLHNEIMIKVKEYFDNVICTLDEVEPYIALSWLNWTEPNQKHHEHFHYNSLISGVYYVNCFENTDSIRFINENKSTIKFSNFKEYHLFNSDSWKIPVSTGTIIMFPSYLKHKVETNHGGHTRTSLAFNIFIKGKIGNKKELAYLEIK